MPRLQILKLWEREGLGQERAGGVHVAGVLAMAQGTDNKVTTQVELCQNKGPSASQPAIELLRETVCEWFIWQGLISKIDKECLSSQSKQHTAWHTHSGHQTEKWAKLKWTFIQRPRTHLQPTTDVNTSTDTAKMMPQISELPIKITMWITSCLLGPPRKGKEKQTESHRWWEWGEMGTFV